MGKNFKIFLLRNYMFILKKILKIYIKNKIIKLLNCNLKDLCGSKLVLLIFILFY